MLYRFSRGIVASWLQLGALELQHPRTMFKLVFVVQHRVVRLSIHPHAVDDLEPTLTQPTQGIGVTAAFIAVMAVVDFRPGTTVEGLLSE